MAKVSQARMYSWWWDSHISPKNSKWLQENLTDMDANVKTMIKLIEEDADSFARRAEMYYKKRPELMKLVEEFYRAYRALAERYDNATGVLRQAHRTMAEAFPNQVPVLLGDDSPASSASDPRTPDMPPPTRLLFDHDDSQMDASGPSSSHLHSVKRNGGFAEESNSSTSRKGLKQLNNSLCGSGDKGKFAEGRVRKSLNFHEKEEKGRSVQSNENEQIGKYEEEIKTLKEALSKLEAEKEAGLVQYRQSVERLSNLESEVSRTQEDSRGLNERASKAETEIQNLNEALAKLEGEREASFLQYQQCLEKISNLESVISSAKEDAGEHNERASKAETEAQVLKQELATVQAEKDTALDQYKQSLEMISNLKKKLSLAEEDARKINERAEKAESEVENLKEALVKLTEEKEAAALQYQQCLETISSLESKISFAQEEAQRLNGEIDDGVAKLKGAEEQCALLERSHQSLHSELESVVLKMGTQTQELTENQKELGRLWTCIQEERLRFVEAETAFQTLQHLHAQAQEDLRSLGSELQSRALILRDMETRNQSLQDEVLKVKEENKHLDELNLSSSMLIKDLRDEIFGLRDTKGKLEEELVLRVDQRNALQQEIYCLKEELNELNKKQSAIVKELQEENSVLTETCKRERSEKVALLEKLEIMQQLLQKNALLENSLSDLSAELEGVRGKIGTLEESFQSLLEEKTTLVAEKATLVTNLQVTTENLEKLSEKNTFLENSLADAHAELEGLKANSKSLEDLFLVLDNEKSGLISQKDTLVSQLNISQQQFEELGKRYTELEEKYSGLEKEKKLTFCRVEELQVFLNNAKQELASFTQLSDTRLAGMETQICLLQEEGQLRRREFEEELDKAIGSQIEIFVLQICVKDLEENNSSLLIECQKLSKASKFSEKLISELQEENLEKQAEVKSLFDQTNKLKRGLYQLLKVLNIDDKNGQEQTYLNHILLKLEESIICVCKTQDENHELVVQNSVLVTLLGQLRLEAESLQMERNNLDKEYRMKTEHFSLLQSEARELLELNEALRLKVKEGGQKEEVLNTQMENLRGKLLDLERVHQNLQEENSNVLEEKRSLMEEFVELGEKNCTLEEESFVLFGEKLLLSGLSLIFENFVNEKSVELKEVGEDIEKLLGINSAFEETLRITERKLEEVEMDNFHLKEALKKSEDEFKTRLFVTEFEKSELVIIVEDLKQEHDEVELIRKNQKKQIFELCEENCHLQEENANVLEEKRSLMEEFVELGEKNCTLEEESCVLFGEKFLLSSLSLIFENFVNEKSVELKEVGEDTEKLRGINNAFKETLRITERKLEEVEMDNFHLKEALKKSEDEFKTRLFVTEFEKSELQIIAEDLKQEHGEVELIRKNQEKHIFELCEENGHLSEENGSLCEANWKLEVKVQQLHEETEKGKNKEENLLSELQRGKKEIDMWESEASALFGELQFSSVCQAVFESKLHEFTEAYESLENEHTLDIKVLKERVSSLEGENGGLKAQLAAYVPSVMSLRDCISSLENRSSLRSKLQGLDNVEEKDCEMVSNLNIKSSASESQSAMVPDAFSDLQDLQTRIKAIEKALIEENLDANAKLEAAIKQIDELKSKSSSPNANSTSEISETENGLLTKDIMLDQISECSSYGIGRRDHTENDNQMLELWETTDQNGSIDLTVGKVKKSANPTSEKLVEKELAVDKLEISKSSSEPRKEENQRKVLERLNSDVQKLTNLRITVQDLKRKVETIEKSKKGKPIIECDTVKGQLEEAEAAILKLFDQNGKLMKNIEDSSFSSDGKFEIESEEKEGIRKKRISEQARRVSEKIGRLQLEIQKIQFALLKLDDDEREIKGKVSIPETKRRVLLRDYLYGGGRSTPRRKKGHFCSCVQPPTKGD